VPRPSPAPPPCAPPGPAPANPSPAPANAAAAPFAATGRQPSIKIFGHDYRTHDGTCIRDYVHVNLSDADVAAIDWLRAGKPSDSFNLGNGRGFSVAEVVRTSEKVTGLSVQTEMCARRPGAPPTLVSDSSKARRMLGWTPKFPD
jgi:UDP-glucose 4-epimerase